MSDLEQDLKDKITVSRKYVALCTMNACTRGFTPAVVIAMEDSEGIANSLAETHRNDHRERAKDDAKRLEQIRAADGVMASAVEAEITAKKLLGEWPDDSDDASEPKTAAACVCTIDFKNGVVLDAEVGCPENHKHGDPVKVPLVDHSDGTTEPCDGTCGDDSPHDSHLTDRGREQYTGAAS
jgi:hypothetical protein